MANWRDVLANTEEEWEKQLQSVPASTEKLAVSGNLRQLPDSVIRLDNLQRLRLDHCPRLQSLPNNLSVLKGLTRLIVDTCPQLGTLPELTSLRHLQWHDQAQSLPPFLDNATGLSILQLDGSEWVRFLPEGVTQLKELRDLRLAGCSSLQELPLNITRLAHLESLNLTGCKVLQSLPSGLENLTYLKYLHCDGCEQLQVLPKGMGQLPALETLTLAGCVRLQSLPEDLSNVRTLETLDVSDCVQLESFPLSIGKLPGLRVLRLDGCPRIPDETLFKIPYRRTLDQALVGPRQRRASFVVGQQHTLEQCMTAVSWIGILMATASFLGFVSVPGGFQPGGVVRVGEIGAPFPALNQSALSLYFASDMVTFLVALATTVYAVTQNMPSIAEPTAQEVSRQIAVSSFLLLITITFGVITFVSGAFAVYPVNTGNGLMLAAVMGGAFVVGTSGYLISRVWRIGAALQWGRVPEVDQPPAKGEAELLLEMLSVLREIKVHCHSGPNGTFGDHLHQRHSMAASEQSFHTAHHSEPSRGMQQGTTSAGSSHGAHVLTAHPSHGAHVHTEHPVRMHGAHVDPDHPTQAYVAEAAEEIQLTPEPHHGAHEITPLLS